MPRRAAASTEKETTRPSAAYTALYPKKMPAKITVRLQDGTTIEHEVQDYPGLASRPLSLVVMGGGAAVTANYAPPGMIDGVTY
jgi:2-methylcitrate dehydratase PrpD